MSVIRQLGWFAAMQAVLLRSLGAALAVRAATNSNSNTTIATDLSSELLKCSTTLIIPILQYVVTNYIAHAFTIRFSPGYARYYTIIFSLKALIFPCFGLLTACRTVEVLAATEEDPLTRALEAGALCTVARTKLWKPEQGDDIWLPNEPSNTTSVPQGKTPECRITPLGPDHNEKGMISDRERGKVINDMLPIYCQEEGVEGLHQSYINVHGLCRLPRVHAYGTTVDGNGNICTRCKNTRLDECPEDAPAGLQLRHCQKGQYMLVRIPPHCKVDWKDRKYFHERVRRYHAKDTRMERFKMFLTGSFGSSERTGKREDPQTRSSGDKHSIRAHSAESRNPRSSSSSDNHQTQNSDNKPYITRFDFGIAGSQSTIKSFVALVQLFSIIRILRANTLEDYGAYQLTLIPYALMSFVNIISSFFTPSYPAVYMVRSTVMEEAERRGGVFDGWIGILDEGGEVTMRHTTVDHGMMAEPGLSIDLDAVEGQEPWKDPSKREGPEQSKDPKADELPKLPKDPPTGEPLSPSESLITGEPFNPGEPLTIVEPLTANKPQSPGDLGRAGGAELKKQPIISFGRFWDATELRRGTYFHHLKRTLPFIRFIRLTLKQNTETSQQIFGNVFNDYITESRDPSKYYFVLQIGNAKHRAAAKKWMPLFMDIFMIVALAVPWVTIYFLTKFKAPKGHVHGVFFMLWLLLGQLLPFLLVPSWSLINLKIWRIKLNKAILVSSMCVSLTAFAAFGGFYFVGRLRYQELAQNNNNCTAARNHLSSL